MKKKIFSLTASLLILTTSAFGAIELTDQEKDLSIRNVKAENGVVASAHPLASKVGLEILKRGGNAVDAAVGVAFTLGLVEPNASGPGGGGYMLINKDNKQKCYSYYQKAPKGLTQQKWEELYKSKEYRKDGRWAMIPGFVAGMSRSLEEQGTMSMKEILEPIIELAEDGFIITPHLAEIMTETFEKLSANDSIANTFLNDGLPYEEGERFKNKDYAKTLKLIAEKGRDGFYKGEVAQSLMKANPFIESSDLEGYEALVLEPISSEYRNHKVVTTAPESGGVIGLEILNIMENYNLNQMGNSSKSYHLWAEALNLAQIDRYYYIGDPTMGKVRSDILASQEYADSRKAEIDPNKASGKVKPGYIMKNLKESKAEYGHPSTTHVSVIDKDGNAVSMTNTVGLYFGCGVVPEKTGFVLNSHFSNFSKKTQYPINRYQPGKRPRTTMGPTMVFDKKGNLELVVGTPGATRILSTIPQVISNIIDKKMDMQEAINAPRIHKVKGKLYVEGSVPKETKEYLKKLGHKITEKKINDSYFGGVHAIEVLPDGTYEGGADPRRDGKALGY